MKFCRKLWSVSCGARGCSGAASPPAGPAAPPAAAGAGAAADSADDEKAGEVLCVRRAGDGGFELSAAARARDQRSGGALCRALAQCGCGLRAGGALLLPGEGAGAGGALAVACVGAPGAADGYCQLEQLDEAREALRCGVGAAVRLLAARGCGAVRVDGAHAPDAAAEGAELAAWGFQEFKSCDTRERDPRVHLLAGEEDGKESGEAGEGRAALWAEGAVRARAQNWARWLADMPANRMTPIDFAQAALETLCPLGVRVQARGREWIAAQRMRAFLGVARGACSEPALLECSYEGPGASGAPPVLLVAKGITFDSGGLCLKRPAELLAQRGSLAGAAAALAALRALAELKVPLRVECVVPLCEHMLSGHCLRVGDVLPALNGLTIQVEDTALAGRLLLADALVYAQARYKPSLVVDVASLTQGIELATGGGAFGCFSNSEPLWAALRAAGARAGDRPWRFPLWRYYRQQLTDDAAVDLRNKGSGRAAPCLGAAFLQHFVCGPWLHLDVTGVARPTAAAGAAPYLRAGRMSGRPTRALQLFLQHVAQQQQQLAQQSGSAAAH